jgi:hypothetical protein
MSIFARRAFILATTLLVARGVQLSAQTDPFAGVTPATSTNEQPEERPQAWFHRFTHSNFGFRGEIMSQFVVDDAGNAASRQSLGFEVLKKFSSETATLASFNFQGRLVRRDGFVPVRNDMEGQARPGWALEYHNAYVDLYNVAFLALIMPATVDCLWLSTGRPRGLPPPWRTLDLISRQPWCRANRRNTSGCWRIE